MINFRDIIAAAGEVKPANLKLLEPGLFGLSENAAIPGPAEFINLVYRVVVALGAVAAVIIIVIAGIQYITTFANPGAKAAAKQRIWNALGGLFLLLIITFLLTLINGGVPLKITDREGLPTDFSCSDNESDCTNCEASFVGTYRHLGKVTKSEIKWVPCTYTAEQGCSAEPPTDIKADEQTGIFYNSSSNGCLLKQALPIQRFKTTITQNGTKNTFCRPDRAGCERPRATCDRLNTENPGSCQSTACTATDTRDPDC